MQVGLDPEMLCGPWVDVGWDHAVANRPFEQEKSLIKIHFNTKNKNYYLTSTYLIIRKNLFLKIIFPIHSTL